MTERKILRSQSCNYKQIGGRVSSLVKKILIAELAFL